MSDFLWILNAGEMMFQKVVMLLLALVALTGCAAQVPPAKQLPPLEKNQSTYIAMPKDVPDFDDSPGGGIVDAKRYPGTGAEIVVLLKETLAPYAGTILTGSRYETDEEAIESGKKAGARYVLIPFFNIQMQRRMLWEARVYRFSLILRTFDLQSASKEPVRSVGMRIYQKNTMPPAQTPKDIDALFKSILPGYAKTVYETGERAVEQ